MPQVDKATFLPIVFWAFAIYVIGFLYLNTGAMYTFLSSMKTAVKFGLSKFAHNLSSRRRLFVITFFPLLAI